MEYAANESCYNKPVVPLIPVLLAVQVDSVLSVRYHVCQTILQANPWLAEIRI